MWTMDIATGLQRQEKRETGDRKPDTGDKTNSDNHTVCSVPMSGDGDGKGLYR
jgi:hypothetical protein